MTKKFAVIGDNCPWTYYDHFDLWEAECGGAWSGIEGTPAENEINYCPKCGRPLVEVDPPEPANPLRARVVQSGAEEDV